MQRSFSGVSRVFKFPVINLLLGCQIHFDERAPHRYKCFTHVHLDMKSPLFIYLFIIITKLLLLTNRIDTTARYAFGRVNSQSCAWCEQQTVAESFLALFVLTTVQSTPI